MTVQAFVTVVGDQIVRERARTKLPGSYNGTKGCYLVINTG